MNVLVGIVLLLVGFAFFFFLSELYIRVRRRLNTPKIGVEILLNLLKRDDYVSINGKVRQFSHFANDNQPLNILSSPSESNRTIGGEIAFVNNHGLGYVYYYPSAMANCDFIFGRYGLKWARDRVIASTAKEKIKRYRYE